MPTKPVLVLTEFRMSIISPSRINSGDARLASKLRLAGLVGCDWGDFPFVGFTQ